MVPGGPQPEGALTGLAAALLAEGGRSAWQPTGQQGPAAQPRQPARPADLDGYWPQYLLQLQLAGHPEAAPAAAAPADATAAHLQLLQALSKPVAAAAPAAASRGGGSFPLLGSGLPALSGGLTAPRAVRPQDSQVPMSLSEFALQLKKQAPAALPGTSGASAFSQLAGYGVPKAGSAANGASPFDGGAAGAAAGDGGAAAGLRRQDSDGLKRQGSDPLRRQGSDSLRRGSSGSLPSSARGTPGLATGKRGTKRTTRETLASEALPLKKRLDLSRTAATHADAAADADDDGESGEEGAEMTLVRMRSGEAPAIPQPAQDQDKGAEAGAAGGPKCSKEKNRQAQRRFRERQKTLIGDLREHVRSLQADVDSQAKQIFVLQEENRLLKMLLSERQILAAGQQQQAA